MPFWLRKVRVHRWLDSADIPWLHPGDMQAAALTDLSADSNTLSMYWIHTDKSNLERVVTALAASCDTVSKIGFALVDEEDVAAFGIMVQSTPGATPDAAVNGWHSNFEQLTQEQVCRLARALFDAKCIDSRTPGTVKSMLASGVDKGYFAHADLSERIQREIAPGSA